MKYLAVVMIIISINYGEFDMNENNIPADLKIHRRKLCITFRRSAKLCRTLSCAEKTNFPAINYFRN